MTVLDVANQVLHVAAAVVGVALVMLFVSGELRDLLRGRRRPDR